MTRENRRLARLRRQGRRASKLARESARYVAGGMKKCSQEQVDSRFTVCAGCEYYTPSDDIVDSGECELCECNCNRDVKFLNKLAWKCQTCPLLKWDCISDS